MKTKARWIIGGTIVATLVAACGWLVLTDAPTYQFLVRLYVDKRFLKHTISEPPENRQTRLRKIMAHWAVGEGS